MLSKLPSGECQPGRSYCSKLFFSHMIRKPIVSAVLSHLIVPGLFLVLDFRA